VDYVPDWPNVELGKTTERRLAARILASLRSLRIIYANRRSWRAATMVYVRNLDLALLTLLARVITRCRAPLVFEVLDVHPKLAERGARAALLRWLERRVLNRCELLVVSSPAFLKNYFQPLQHYTGQTFLLENKWPREDVWTEDRKLAFDLDEHRPVWIVGWFGNLRCPRSLEILTELADALPDRVQIYMRGCPSLLGARRLENAIGGRPNMVFAGEYVAPAEFASIYSNVHFNWCADFSDGDNSRWLLPNRLYEGGYFGIPAIAIAGHETGRVVRERHLGITLEAPYAHSMKDLLDNLTSEQYRQLRQRIEAMPSFHFVDTGEMAELMRLAPAAQAQNHTEVRPSRGRP
jgi:succinoglycan biosynthesis protein ExoL